MTYDPYRGKGPPSPGGQPLNYSAGPGGPVPYMGPPPDQDSKSLGMLAHLLGILAGWLGPLIMWLIKKDTNPFVADQAKEALNWELTMLIILLPLELITVIASIATRMVVVGCLFGFLIFAVCVCNIVYCIIGAVAANKGIAYRYPFALRLVK